MSSHMTDIVLFSKIAIDTIAVENKAANNMYQRSVVHYIDKRPNSCCNNA